MSLVRLMVRSAASFGYKNIKRNFSIPSPNAEADLKISQACVDRLKKITSEAVFLRITVDGGGCSGFQYRFDLDSHLQDDDKCFEKQGVKIVVDKISLPFLKGSTVDYHEELIRSAFRIVDNPQADSRCSCGASFGIKMP